MKPAGHRACAHCHRRFSANHRFCAIDGTALVAAPEPDPRPRACPRCQRSYDPDHRFCVDDGTELEVVHQLLRTKSVQKKSLIQSVFDQRYFIRGFIGKGTTARVYMAEDLQLGG